MFNIIYFVLHTAGNEKQLIALHIFKRRLHNCTSYRGQVRREYDYELYLRDLIDAFATSFKALSYHLRNITRVKMVY
jgi:hypothetical protein